MILLCLIFVLSITEQISTEENESTNITVLNVQPDTNLSQRLYRGLKGGSLIQKGGKAPEYVPSKSKYNERSRNGRTNKKGIDLKKNNKPKQKTYKEKPGDKMTINIKHENKGKKKPKKIPTKKPKNKPKKKPTKKPRKKSAKKPTKKPTKKSAKKPTKKPTKKSAKKPTKKPDMEVEENEVNHTEENRNATNLSTTSTTEGIHNSDEHDDDDDSDSEENYSPIHTHNDSSGEDESEAYKKEDNSTIPKTKSPCCNAEIINIFHEMDLESRRWCIKRENVLELPLETQPAKRGCIAGCVAIRNRYLTNSGQLFVNEYISNLKYAFRELTWTTEIMDAIVNSCVEKFEFHNEFSMGCKTKMYDIGVCIGKKLQFECYENYLDKDSSEDKCNQDLLDVTYSKCTNPSPGYGCHVIR